MPGVQSLISKASGAKADIFVDAGEKVQIGNLLLEVYDSVSMSARIFLHVMCCCSLLTLTVEGHILHLFFFQNEIGWVNHMKT